MSSAQDKSHQSPQSASPQKPKADIPTDSVSQPPSSAENEMDQSLDSPLTAIPPVRPRPPENRSSTENIPSADKAASAKHAPSVENSPPPENISSTNSTPAHKIDTPVDSSPQPEESAGASPSTMVRQQPIPPASEPMQYRAIGLIRGKYKPSEEQFTRGEVHTDDGFEVGAVLLGRVMSLVKKHLDLEESHLWVVYPRTREKGDTGLHVQIVGVWEPEKLNRTEEPTEPTDQETPESEEDTADNQASSEASEAVELPPIAASELDDKYFSVRGEIIFQSLEDNRILVKIRRSARPGDDPKAFKVSLLGTLEGKAVGYFWDLNVQREGNELVLKDGTLIAPVPPQKRGKGERKPFRRPGGGGSSRGGGQKRWNNGPRSGPPRSPRPNTGGPPRKPGAIGKPIQKRRDQNKSEDKDS